jgi:hypothetical protein
MVNTQYEDHYTRTRSMSTSLHILPASC